MENTEVKFLDKVITLHPLNIFTTKKLRAVSSRLILAEGEADKIKTPEAIAARESLVADCIVDTVKEMMEAYGVAVTRDDLERHFSLNQLSDLLYVQCQLNGSDDFLIRPIMRILEVYMKKGESDDSGTPSEG